MSDTYQCLTLTRYQHIPARAHVYIYIYISDIMSLFISLEMEASSLLNRINIFNIHDGVGFISVQGDGFVDYI